MRPIEIAHELDKLATELIATSVTLDYFAGFDSEAKHKAKLLQMTAGVVVGWAEEIKRDMLEDKNI